MSASCAVGLARQASVTRLQWLRVQRRWGAATDGQSAFSNAFAPIRDPIRIQHNNGESAPRFALEYTHSSTSGIQSPRPHMRSPAAALNRYIRPARARCDTWAYLGRSQQNFSCGARQLAAQFPHR